MRNIAFGTLTNANDSGIFFRIIVKNNIFNIDSRTAEIIDAFTLGSGILVKQAVQEDCIFMKDGIWLNFDIDIYDTEAHKAIKGLKKVFIPRNCVESVEALASYPICREVGLFSLNQVKFYRM